MVPGRWSVVGVTVVGGLWSVAGQLEVVLYYAFLIYGIQTEMAIRIRTPANRTPKESK